MEYKEYRDTEKRFEHALNHMMDALHSIYECTYSLRQCRDDDAKTISDMIDGIKPMLESWKESIDEAQQNFLSDNWDESFMEWEE